MYIHNTFKYYCFNAGKLQSISYNMFANCFYFIFFIETYRHDFNNNLSILYLKVCSYSYIVGMDSLRYILLYDLRIQLRLLFYISTFKILLHNNNNDRVNSTALYNTNIMTL